MAENNLHLSVKDQNSARCYTQTLQIFPFPDEHHIDTAVQTLSEALRFTLAKFPFLAGTIGPADTEDTGRLSLRYPTEGVDLQRTGLFASRKLSGNEYTYAQLKEAGMPPSAFQGSDFCPDVLRNRKPAIPDNAEGIMPCTHQTPVLAVQAFFIPGGLVLSIYVQHSVLDCCGISTLWKNFAENVQRVNNGGGPSDEKVPDQSTLRSQLDARIPLLESPTADAYIRNQFEYGKTLGPKEACSAKLFVISAERIHAFRDKLLVDVCPSTKLTICNVLAALVWIHVTRARGARLLKEKCGSTSLGISIDGRRRLDPPLSDDYMGDMSLFAKTTSLIEDFLSEELVTESMILSTALQINQTINAVDNAWMLRHLAFFQQKVPIRDTEPALAFRFGPDLYITSWLNFGAEHEWNIPGTTSSKPEAIRRTTDRNSDGGMTILPRRRTLIDGQEAPYEILIRLATQDMQRLESEEGGLRSWADRVIE